MQGRASPGVQRGARHQEAAHTGKGVRGSCPPDKMSSSTVRPPEPRLLPSSHFPAPCFKSTLILGREDGDRRGPPPRLSFTKTRGVGCGRLTWLQGNGGLHLGGHVVGLTNERGHALQPCKASRTRASCVSLAGDGQEARDHTTGRDHQAAPCATDSDTEREARQGPAPIGQALPVPARGHLGNDQVESQAWK